MERYGRTDSTAMPILRARHSAPPPLDACRVVAEDQGMLVRRDQRACLDSLKLKKTRCSTCTFESTQRLVSSVNILLQNSKQTGPKFGVGSLVLGFCNPNIPGRRTGVSSRPDPPPPLLETPVGPFYDPRQTCSEPAVADSRYRSMCVLLARH